MNKKGYIAGSLFNEAEVAQRLKEGALLREVTGDRIDWFNPIEAPINDKAKLPTAMDIFKGDTEAVIAADYIVADITNNDVGVAMELGIAYGLQYAKTILDEMFRNSDPELKAQIDYVCHKHGIKHKNIYATCSDIRIGTSGDYDGIYVPYGINQYMVGGLECMNAEITGKFDDALKIIESDLLYEDLDVMMASVDFDEFFEDEEETWQLKIED